MSINIKHIIINILSLSFLLLIIVLTTKYVIGINKNTYNIEGFNLVNLRKYNKN